MDRYVILEHDSPVLHWDFMLEAGAALRTWRLAAPPREGQAIEACALGDHRLAYLDYEGPVSGNRGTVKRWDQGSFACQKAGPGRVEVRLKGERLQGVARLEPEEGVRWRFTFQGARS